MKRVRRIDVAKAAGVSQTTVSYVLRNTPGVNISDDTRKRVLDVAEKLGYQVNFAAASLVRGKTDIIGLLLPSQEHQFFIYYSMIITGMIEEVKDMPYFFLYLGHDHEDKYRSCFERNYLDGAIIVQSRYNDKHIEIVDKYNKPFITVNYLREDLCPGVSMDYEGAVDTSYEYLAGKGRKKVVFVCADKNLQPNRRHIRRHKEVVKQFNHSMKITNIDYEEFEDSGRVFEEILDVAPWDGIVVDGEELGWRIIKKQRKRGKTLGVDYDLSVFTTGEHPLDLPPGILLLTAQPEEMGKQAWKMMHTLLAGEEIERRTVLIPFTKVITNTSNQNGRKRSGESAIKDHPT